MDIRVRKWVEFPKLGKADVRKFFRVRGKASARLGSLGAFRVRRNKDLACVHIV